MTATTKRQELVVRVQILEKLAAEIREMERKRREQAGPQRIEDLHTEARWLGLAKPERNGL